MRDRGTPIGRCIRRGLSHFPASRAMRCHSAAIASSTRTSMRRTASRAQA